MGAFPHRHFAAPLSPGCRIEVIVRGINALWQPPACSTSADVNSELVNKPHTF